MMITEEGMEEVKTEFTWKELSDTAKDAARRHFDPNGDWHECVIEQFKEEMKELGVTVEDTYYSGFWSQGDGASWKGSVDMPAYLLRAHPDDLKRMCLLQVIEEGHITNQVVIGCGYSNYVHDGTMTATADLSVPCDEVFAKPSVFMGTNVQERLEALGWTEQELDVLLQAVLEWARSKARSS